MEAKLLLVTRDRCRTWKIWVVATHCILALSSLIACHNKLITIEKKLKEHTTNYINTFIEVAEDCPVLTAEIPDSKGDKESVARIEYDLISKHPYVFTSDDILFQVYAKRNDLTEADFEEARKELFSKGQACLRSSPLTKRYGWGIHNNSEGKIALYGLGTEEYEKMINDKNLKVVKAMRSKRI